MIKKLILVWCVALLSVGAMAQNRHEDAYKKYRSERQREFEDYKARANARYADFLKKRWQDYNAESGEKPETVVQPRPERITDPAVKPLPEVRPDLERIRKIVEQNGRGIRPAPQVRPKNEHGMRPRPEIRPRPEVRPQPGVKPRPRPRPAKPNICPPKPQMPKVQPELKPQPEPQPETPDIRKEEEEDNSDEELSIDFFGDGLRMKCSDELTPRLERTSEDGFAALWKEWSSEADDVVDCMAVYAREHHLNGWGHYQLAKRVSEAAYPADRPNERIAMQCFLLSQLKFHAQIALCGERFVLLLPFKEAVYNVPYLVVGNRRHYIYSYGHNPSEGFRTYDRQFEYADRNLSLHLDGRMQVGLKQEMAFGRMSRLLGAELKARINVGEVAMMLHCPMMKGEVYYAQGVDADLAQSLLPALRRAIAGKSEVEAVQYLLNFVQNGFDYATDEELFGRQKQLFIEESFYYGKNNCKDRVGVFSWLVRELLGLKMVSISYEGNAASKGVGHITCGVRFSSDVAGDAFLYGGDRYVMCDPTYINARIGMTMPAFRQSKATLRAL